MLRDRQGSEYCVNLICVAARCAIELESAHPAYETLVVELIVPTLFDICLLGDVGGQLL